MTEIRFYHLERQSQAQVLPMLLTKALEKGHKIIVKLRNAADVEQMSDHLWSYDPTSFLPHGTEKSGKAELQPVYLTDQDENQNGADVLITCSGATSEKHGDYKLCCEMLDGHDQEVVVAARDRWKIYKDNGFEVTYWQQNESGGWDKKA